MADGGRVLLTSDVTERRRRQQQLSLLAMAVDQVGDAVEITDAQGRFTYVNPRLRAADRLRRGRGDRPAAAGGPAQRAARCGVYDAIAAACSRAALGRACIVNRRKDGELISQDTTISPLRDAHGRITHYVAVKRDVTEQEKAEAAIRASEARYRRVVDDADRVHRPHHAGRPAELRQRRLLPLLRPAARRAARPRFNDFTGTLAGGSRARRCPSARAHPEQPVADHRAAARCSRRHDALGAVGRHRASSTTRAAGRDPVGRPGHHRAADERAGAARQRGQLPGPGRDPDRVRAAPAPGRRADLRQRGLLPLCRQARARSCSGGLERPRHDRRRRTARATSGTCGR